jgi:hypothetical protein
VVNVMVKSAALTASCMAERTNASEPPMGHRKHIDHAELEFYGGARISVSATYSLAMRYPMYKTCGAHLGALAWTGAPDW